MGLKFILFKTALVIIICLLPLSALSADFDGSRKKALDFDESLVEGVNKRPLDSLSQIAENEKNRRGLHLYWIRDNFNSQNQRSLKEIGFTQ